MAVCISICWDGERAETATLSTRTGRTVDILLGHFMTTGMYRYLTDSTDTHWVNTTITYIKEVTQLFPAKIHNAAHLEGLNVRHIYHIYIYIYTTYIYIYIYIYTTYIYIYIPHIYIPHIYI